MRQNIITLSLAGDPALVSQLTHLITELNQAADSPIVALVLFGSVARLTAGQSSDADLLALHADAASEEQATTWLFRHIRSASQSGDEDGATGDGAAWHMIPVIGNARASDLDPDFLGGVSQDGILLYHMRDHPLPPALAHLRSFATWRDEVSVLVDALRLAADQLSAADDPSAKAGSR